MLILDVGGGNGVRSRNAYPYAEIEVLDKKLGFDVEQQEIPPGADIILANHIIEHLSDPDDFLDKCYRAMDDECILEISTPNMCAWFNRILFMFGYLPHSYEVSFRHNVGKLRSWGNERLGGHIRLFSCKSLIQLLRFHGFRVLSVKGERNPEYRVNPLVKFFDILFTRNPHTASSFRIKARKI